MLNQGKFSGWFVNIQYTNTIEEHKIHRLACGPNLFHDNNV